MARTRQNTISLRIQAQCQAGHEPVFQAAMQAAVEDRKDFRRIVDCIRHGADGSNDQRDGHGCLKTLAAHVA